MIEERILKYPGFIYDIGGTYYFLGKWICKESLEVDANDCVFMYQMNRRQNEEKDTNFYFQKIRAYSDFALEVPYNPAQIEKDLKTLIDGLSDAETASLEKQLSCFEEDYPKFCGKDLSK